MVGTVPMVPSIAQGNVNEPTMEHLPSVENTDVVEIQLNLKNSCSGSFPNRQKALLLWDSGATASIISEGTISNNPYLQSIRQTPILPKKFMVGNGAFILAKTTITFVVIVQENLFTITAYIVPSLGGIDAIIGTGSMKDLEASLSFKHNIIRFKTKATILKLIKNVVLRPGETRVLEVKANVPDIIKSSEVYFQATRFIAQFTPSYMMIKLNKGISRIIMRNNSNRTVRLRNDKPMAPTHITFEGSSRIDVRGQQRQNRLLPVSTR